MPSSPDVLRSSDRPRAVVLGAFLEGWRRVLGAPAMTLSILVLTFLSAAPLAYVLRGQIDAQLGSTLRSERLLGGWDAEWASDFAGTAPGIGRTLTHEILGFGGTLSALSRLVDRQPVPPAIAAAIAVYIALWVFLSGGVIDRLARARPVRASVFFAACGVYFVRFLRLAIVIGACYWTLFRWLHPWLFVTIYNRWTRDLTLEHQGLAIRALLYAVFLGTLALVNVIADFAKVRSVVEDRRSMVGALGAAIRFVRRRPVRVLGLYLVNIVALLVIARLWLQTAPSAAAPTWLALLAAQMYLLLRIWGKLAFIASEVAFFQGELAHASFTAAPEPVWPDSPGVEAIRNLRQ